MLYNLCTINSTVFSTKGGLTYDSNKTSGFIVSRKQNKNVVVISESEYNELQRAKRNAEYLKRLNESMAQANEGNTITLSLDELQAMESDDWKPSQKMLDFMEKINNE